ncbi:MAG TPA: MarR family winged helix-turn-helix transcriptional regulator [Microlunatus sp.]|nr:MarR family winged helix-turn-helix transcriptional regulator [Microlunatus sp.]
MQPPATETTATSVDSVIGALHAIGRLIRQGVGGRDLDPGSFWMLKTVAGQGPLRVTELAGHANLDTSTVSRHVTQLERSGFVERVPDPEDRRAQLVVLSIAGRHRLESAMAQRRALLTAGLRDWPAEDITELARLLDRFVSDIDTTTAPQENA